jgi:hypothetical protein
LSLSKTLTHSAFDCFEVHGKHRFRHYYVWSFRRDEFVSLVIISYLYHWYLFLFICPIRLLVYQFSSIVFCFVLYCFDRMGYFWFFRINFGYICSQLGRLMVPDLSLFQKWYFLPQFLFFDNLTNDLQNTRNLPKKKKERKKIIIMINHRHTNLTKLSYKFQFVF